MSKLLTLLLSVVASAFFVGPALAGTDPGPTPTTGWIEVCKAPSATLTDSFQFKLTAGEFTKVTDPVPAGACSVPIEVPAGHVMVEELATLTSDGHGGNFSTADYTAVSAITTSAPGALNAQLNSADLGNRMADVTVNPSAYMSDETIVNFTNDPVQGYVEICKSKTPGVALDGLSYAFTVTGGNGFSQSGSVTVGACSNPILAPAGHVIVQETGAAIYVDAITSPTHSLLPPAAPDMVTDPMQVAAGWVAVSVTQNGTISQESIVNFENNISQLKICKFAAQGSEALTGETFSFNVNGATVPVVAGHWGDTSHCVIAGSYPAGTAMTVTEAPMPGVEVSNILLSDQRPWILGGSDFTGVTASFTLQAGVTTMYIADKIADPGELKVCKNGPAGEPPVTVTVTGPRGIAPNITTGTDTLTVPVGQCVLDPNPMPFAGVQVVTEQGQAGYAVTAARVDDPALLASPLSGSSISAYIGNHATYVGGPALADGSWPVVNLFTAMVTFTNGAAIAPAPVTPAAPTAGASGGGGGSSSDPAPAAPTPAAAPAPQAPAPTVVAPAVVKTKAIVKSSLSASQIKNHRVIVRVVGSAKKATIRVTLYNAKHKVLRSVLRSVMTNRAVVVPNLKLGPAVKHYKVKVL